jgi:hypothetical protein
MKREGVWETMCKLCSAKANKAVLLGIIVALAVWQPSFAADGDNVVLPSAQQLITMSIGDRLALFEAMKTLPTNQRNANSKALEAEINSLTPQQKTEMENHFRAEFNALPPDQQQQVMAKLQQLRPQQ